MKAPEGSGGRAAGSSTHEQAAIQRSEIERALDDLISFEEGFKFQSLAVILAKQRWHALVASERKWDLGLDAYAPGLALASSLTATLEKVKEDAQRIRERDTDVATLIFYTPQKVTNYTAGKWAAEIRRAFDLQLIVISREDIITSLMAPSNGGLCATHLGIARPVSQETRQVRDAATQACYAQVQSGLDHPRLRGTPLIPLRLLKVDPDKDESAEIVDLNALRTQLSLGGRLVLEAPAGAGKTTTLLQLAGVILDSGGLCVRIDLSSWLDSGQDVLRFIARSPGFQARGVDAAELARISEQEHMDFLFNGWNEIPERHVESALQRLSGFERDIPRAGMIVATRASSIRPPLPGYTLVRVLPLTNEQRGEYLELALGGRSSELLSRIGAHDTLDKMTRTPLMLSEVMRLFAAGRPLPEAKLDILRAMSMRIQESEQHRGQLQRAPLLGRADSYLSALAFGMAGGGGVGILDHDARRVVSEEVESLQRDRQLSSPLEPVAVLNALCAHHVLERSEYPQLAYRFQHQLFQDFYAALRLTGILEELVRTQEPRAIKEFQVTYLDQPSWDEPLRMIAEGVGIRSEVFSPGTDVLAIGEHLVRWSIPVEPVFAAGLARTCGAGVWVRVRDDVGTLLRRWFGNDDEHHRRLGLAGMLATGSPDFADIIVSVLTSDDDQVRLGAYRAFTEFHQSSIGRDWRRVVRSWTEAYRVEFLHEITLDGGRGDIAEEFAIADPSAVVRAEAIRVLTWVGSSEAVERVSHGMTDETLALLISQGVDRADLPPFLQARAVSALLRASDGQVDVAARLRTLAQAADWGDADALAVLQDELAELAGADARGLPEPVLVAALAAVQESDSEWASRWVAERIIDGGLWADRWIPKVTQFDRDLVGRAWERLSSRELDYRESDGIGALLVKAADKSLLSTVLRFLYQANAMLTRSVDDGGAGDLSMARIARQVTEVARQMPPALLVGGLVDTVSRPPVLSELWTVAGVLGQLQAEESDWWDEVDVELRQQLRTVLANALPFVLVQEDAGGQLKAELALAMARVAVPETVEGLRLLIKADIERRRRGLEARARRERGGIADGAVVSWSRWYVRALTWLGADAAEPVLLELLDEPLYEEDAASALAYMAVSSPTAKSTPVIPLAPQAGESDPSVRVDEEAAARYAEAIAARVRLLMQASSTSEKPDSFAWRAKHLARVLAHVNPRRSADLVMRAMALPGEWDGGLRADALESLLRGRARLATEATLAVLNPAIGHTLQQGAYDQQNAHLLVRFARILVFVDDPARGIDRIRAILSSAPGLRYHLRELVTALGQGGTEWGLDLLLELAQGTDQIPAPFAREWIDAVAAIDRPRSRRFLTSFVDPDVNDPFPELPHDLDDAVAKHIAALAKRAPDVRGRLMELCQADLSRAQRQVLARVIADLDTPEGLVTGLTLLDDRASPPIPYPLARAIEEDLVERRPYRGSSNTYTLHSRNGAQLRRRLLDMLIADTRRRRSAWHLLGEIEGWRLDYGKPAAEPRHPGIDSGLPWPPLDLMLVT